MVQSLQLGNSNPSSDDTGMKRLNRMPFFIGIGIAVLFLAVLVYGLSSRGYRFGQQAPQDGGTNAPASNFAEQMKRGVKDGIIGDRDYPSAFQPTPVTTTPVIVQEKQPEARQEPQQARRPQTESDEEWNARMLREQREQIAREQQRQRMASLQAKGAALDSPLKVDISDVEAKGLEPPVRRPVNRGRSRLVKHPTCTPRHCVRARWEQAAIRMARLRRKTFSMPTSRISAICPIRLYHSNRAMNSSAAP